MTYDVEMADPYHNFVVNDGIVTSNSHAYCVALDALYSAYLKAHYPYEFYSASLSVFSKKGNKDKLAKFKTEMRQAFGITVVPPRFGQDNRDFFVDKENKTISDALQSAKHISLSASETLYRLGAFEYERFIDLLHEVAISTGVNRRQIEILIELGYFAQFGPQGKLLAVLNEFYDGKSKFSKSLVPKTQLKRLDELALIEDLTDGEAYRPSEILRAEVEYLGTPISVFPKLKGLFVVLDVDTMYSPKIHLYSATSGITGTMKVKKATYNSKPIKQGDIIILKRWERSQAYGYSNGVAVPKSGVFDKWIRAYDVLPRPESDTEDTNRTTKKAS